MKIIDKINKAGVKNDPAYYILNSAVEHGDTSVQLSYFRDAQEAEKYYKTNGYKFEVRGATAHISKGEKHE